MVLPPAALECLEAQFGLISRSQLLSSGVKPGLISAWVDRGKLLMMHRGVYRLPGTQVSRRQMLMAAMLRCGEDARAGGWSACGLYRLEGFDLLERPWVLVPPRHRVRGVGFTVQRTALDPNDLATREGIATVTTERALIDLAARVKGKRLRVAIDDARRRDLLTLGALVDRAVALGRHPGAAALRTLFASGLMDQDGELERLLALTLAAVEVYALWGAEVLPGIFPDACLPEASLILECDGRRHHTIDADRANDVTREGPLRADGWHIERIRWRDLTGPRKDATVRRITRLRQERIDAGHGRPPDWRPLSPPRRIRPPTHHGRNRWPWD